MKQKTRQPRTVSRVPDLDSVLRELETTIRTYIRETDRVCQCLVHARNELAELAANQDTRASGMSAKDLRRKTIESETISE
jgi:hypothetical protein